MISDYGQTLAFGDAELRVSGEKRHCVRDTNIDLSVQLCAQVPPAG
jgi:hypothetical protein